MTATYPTPLTWEVDGATRTLVVRGEVGELSVREFGEAISRASDLHPSGLTVDLSEVEFFPSLAVGVVVVAIRGARHAGRTIELVAAEGSVAQRVLSISGLPHRTSGPRER